MATRNNESSAPDIEREREGERERESRREGEAKVRRKKRVILFNSGDQNIYLANRFSKECPIPVYIHTDLCVKKKKYIYIHIHTYIHTSYTHTSKQVH